jgi:hypothetical protein
MVDNQYNLSLDGEWGGVLFGSVDFKGVGGRYDLLPGNGKYADLDETLADLQACILTHNVSLTSGIAYLLKYSLADSRRGDTNTGKVQFGYNKQSFSLATDDPFSNKESPPI